MLRDWLRLARIKPNWLIMVACAIVLSPSPQMGYFLILIVFAYSNAIYGELINMVHDYPIDIQNPKMKNYPHVTGKIKISTIKKVSDAFLLATLITAFALLLKNWILLPLIILALNSTYGYSVPPLRIKRYWWGGLVTYTPYAAVLLLIASIVLEVPLVTAASAALAFWIGSLALWMLAGIPDKDYDLKEGVETPATRFGDNRCVNAYLPLVLLSSALTIVVLVKTTGSLYAGIPLAFPAAIGAYSYLRMKKEANLKITKETLNIAILPNRYNMALATLSFFTFLNN